MSMQSSLLNLNNRQTSFGSAFSVVHWVAETNGSYAPVANLQITKSLQGKIVRILNRQLTDCIKPMSIPEQNLRAYLNSCDVDYRKNPVVRSFYNRVEGTPKKFTPISYLITGNDVDIFNTRFGKNIGEAKGRSLNNSGSAYSSDSVEAIRRYNFGGVGFVKEKSRQIRDEGGIKYILHTKFEILRNKFGKIKDYRFIDARFLPESGSKNPLDKIY